jgi:hypothetical protein
VAAYAARAYTVSSYTLSVTDGTGGGEYTEGATVTISANVPAKGKRFKDWTGTEGLSFTSGSNTSAEASFTMPAKSVSVTANYEDTEQEEKEIEEGEKKKEEDKEKEQEEKNKENEKQEEKGSVKQDRVPLINALDTYASSEDNFAPVQKDGSIKKLILDFSNVAKSGVAPSDLHMTVISGSKCVLAGKLMDKDSAKAKGGVKVKVNGKTLSAKITCKSDGEASFTMEDGVTYTVKFGVQKPKAQKSEKSVSKGSSPVTKTIRELFGTGIDAGELEILKQKHSQAALSGNSLCINPEEKDNIRLQYRYLDKIFKMTVKVK